MGFSVKMKNGHWCSRSSRATQLSICSHFNATQVQAILPDAMSKKASQKPTVLVQTMVEQLKGANELLALQVDAGLDKTETLASMFASCQAQLALVGAIPKPDVADLMRASNGGPWTLEQKKELATRINNNESSPAAHAPKKRLNQTCLHFEKLIPECAWCELRSRNISVLPRAQLIARVGASIGLINPSEPTLFRMVAVLAYGGGDYEMTQQQVWDYMEKIQTFTKSVKTPRDMMYIVDYPVSASLLPDSLASSAYPSGDLPVDVTIPDLDTIISDKKQRGRGRDGVVAIRSRSLSPHRRRASAQERTFHGELPVYSRTSTCKRVYSRTSPCKRVCSRTPHCK